MATQGAQEGPGTLDEGAAPPKADPSALVCPGCHEPTDPDVNQCEHCGRLHFGWLVAPPEGNEQPRDGAGSEHRLVGFLNRNEQRIGGIYVSLISAAVLCGGLLLHGHFEPKQRLCESGVGAFAQEVSSSALKHCSLDSFLAEVGIVIAIFSGLMLGVGLLAVVVTAIAASQQRSASGQ